MSFNEELSASQSHKQNIYIFIYLFILSIHRVDSPFSTKLIFKGVHYR